MPCGTAVESSHVSCFPLEGAIEVDARRRLMDDHRLRVVISLGYDVSGTDAFRMLRAVRARGRCWTLTVGAPHARESVFRQSSRWRVRFGACAPSATGP